MEKIDKAIMCRKRKYQSTELLLDEELQMMIMQKIPISVSTLARRAKVSRATVYQHKKIFDKLSKYRKN